jgi:hypothetical protein
LEAVPCCFSINHIDFSFLPVLSSVKLCRRGWAVIFVVGFKDMFFVAPLMISAGKIKVHKVLLLGVGN